VSHRPVTMKEYPAHVIVSRLTIPGAKYRRHLRTTAISNWTNGHRPQSQLLFKIYISFYNNCTLLREFNTYVLAFTR